VGQINPAVKQSPPEEAWGKGAGGSHRLSAIISVSFHTKLLFRALTLHPASDSCSPFHFLHSQYHFRKQYHLVHYKWRWYIM